MSDLLAGITATSIILSFPLDSYATWLADQPNDDGDDPTAKDDWELSGPVVIATSQVLARERKRYARMRSRGADPADLDNQATRVHYAQAAHNAASHERELAWDRYRNTTALTNAERAKWLHMTAKLMRLPLTAILAAAQGFARGANTPQQRRRRR